VPDISHLPQRGKLHRGLRSVRETTGMSGTRFADHIGIQQARLSRIETGAVLPREDEIRAWAAGADVSPDDLLDRLAAATAEYASWKQQGTGAGKQAEIAVLEQSSPVISKFQPLLIPSQVRTAEYAAALLRLPLGPLTWGEDDPGIDRMVEAQMDRQRILYHPGTHVRIVILEAALYVQLVPRDVMAGQLDRLLAIGALPSLDFRIIATADPVPVFPLSGFVVYDDNLVSVETITGEQRLSDPAEVKAYLAAFDLLYAAGKSGRDVSTLIARRLAQLS